MRSWIILLFFILITRLVTAHTQVYTNIAMGMYHVCAQTEAESVSCWPSPAMPNSSDYGQAHFTNEPAKDFAVGDYFSCILSSLSNDVICRGAIKNPVLKNILILQIVAGNSFACVLYEQKKGIQCWGNFQGDRNGDLVLIDSERALEVKASGDTLCFKTPTELHCYNSLGDKRILDLSLVTNLIGFTSHPYLYTSHAQGRFSIVKWNQENNLQTLSDSLEPLVDYSCSKTHCCTIKGHLAHASTHLQCLNFSGRSPAIFTPTSLNLPYLITTGHHSTCVMDTEGLKCIGQGFTIE